MGDALQLVVGLGILLAALAVAGLAEPRINALMGWSDEQRDARRRNER